MVFNFIIYFLCWEVSWEVFLFLCSWNIVLHNKHDLSGFTDTFLKNNTGLLDTYIIEPVQPKIQGVTWFISTISIDIDDKNFPRWFANKHLFQFFFYITIHKDLEFYRWRVGITLTFMRNVNIVDQNPIR
jgi:hypothetical protein